MTDTSPTTSQVQAELQPLPQRFSILETIKNVLPLLTQLTTFIILGGFVVVHSYLATITDLFTYRISINQYIAAGISLIFYIPIFILGKFAESLGRALLLVALLALLAALYVVVYVVRHRRLSKDPEKSIEEAIGKISHFLAKLQPFRRAFNYFTVLYLIIFAILTGLLYGRTSYPTIPRWLGGGYPASVILIFNKDHDVSAMPFPVTNSRSAIVTLLAELTDGVLVWDEQSKTAIEVKADILDSIVGAAPGKVPDLSTPMHTTQTPAITPIVPTAATHP